MGISRFCLILLYLLMVSAQVIRRITLSHHLIQNIFPGGKGILGCCLLRKNVIVDLGQPVFDGNRWNDFQSGWKIIEGFGLVPLPCLRGEIIGIES